MPPRSGGGHSSHRSSGSSFRSSSSRSSSHSSSTHRSSSFSGGPSRSPFSGGPSRRPSSSHRGSSGTGSGLFSGRGPINNGRPTGQRSSGSSYPRMNPGVVRRTRVSQPLRYNGMVRPLMYYCLNHDYIYYPESWTDTTTGRHYEAGYYDEAGQYYQNVVVNEGGKNKTTIKCEYCDTVVNLEWLEGAALCCPNCGAPLDDAVSNIQKDQAVNGSEEAYQNHYGSNETGADPYNSNYQKTKRKSLPGMLLPILFVFVVLFLVIQVSSAILNSSTGHQGIDIIDDGNSTDPYYHFAEEDSIYVDELGRECEWLGDFYYDEPTDCYFAYYDDGYYQNWQYWYEGISSDYGDYGWMEFDEDDQNWYIETDDGIWEILPSKYLSDRLWHINE